MLLDMHTTSAICIHLFSNLSPPHDVHVLIPPDRFLQVQHADMLWVQGYFFLAGSAQTAGWA